MSQTAEESQVRKDRVMAMEMALSHDHGTTATKLINLADQIQRYIADGTVPPVPSAGQAAFSSSSNGSDS